MLFDMPLATTGIPWETADVPVFIADGLNQPVNGKGFWREDAGPTPCTTSCVAVYENTYTRRCGTEGMHLAVGDGHPTSPVQQSYKERLYWACPGFSSGSGQGAGCYSPGDEGDGA